MIDYLVALETNELDGVFDTTGVEIGDFGSYTEHITSFSEQFDTVGECGKTDSFCGDDGTFVFHPHRCSVAMVAVERPADRLFA